MNNQDTFELRWILTVVRRWLWLIIACTALAGIAAYYVTAQMPPVYEASATLLIEPSKDALSSDYSALIAAERLAQTYSEMLKGRTILNIVIVDLNLDTTAEKLAKKITAQPISDTQLIRLTVEDESPERAAEIANYLAQSFADYIHTTQTGRYASNMAETRLEIQNLDSQIISNQSQIDELQAQVIAAANELEQLQIALGEIRDDTRLTQQDYQEVQLSMAQVMDNVKIIQSAPEPGKYPILPYTASVLLLIEQDVASGGTDYSSILASERLTQTYTQLLSSRSVLQEAITRLGITQNMGVVQNKIRIEPIKDTQLIQLDVVDYDAARAVELANTLAEVFVEQTQASLAEPYLGRLEKAEASLVALASEQTATQAKIDELSAAKVQTEIKIKHLESAIAGDRSTRQDRQDDYERMQQFTSDAAESVFISEPASIPEVPASNRLLTLGLAIVVGGMIGFGFAFLLEYLDDTIRTSDDVTAQLGLGTLGKIGIFPGGENSLIVINDPLSPISEGFRVLANNIRFATLDQPAKRLIITSPSPGEGKSAVMGNLAVTMARLEQSVVAVDADLRMPRLHNLFGIEQVGGLTGALLEGGVNGRLHDVSIEGLKVLPCGKQPSNPTEVIGSARMRNLLKELDEQASLVLIDSPPVLPVADAAVLASMADGVILVLRANASSSRVARDALQSLQQAGAKVIGVVLNAVPARSEGYYSYAYRKKEKKRRSLADLLHKKQVSGWVKRLRAKPHRR